MLVFGWDDIPAKRPFPPEEIESLQQFKPYVFPPLETSRYLAPGELRHRFDFYSK
jgi:hypothetical protein